MTIDDAIADLTERVKSVHAEAVIRVKLDIVVTLTKVSRVKSTRCCDSRVGKALFVTERHGVCS